MSISRFFKRLVSKYKKKEEVQSSPAPTLVNPVPVPTPTVYTDKPPVKYTYDGNGMLTYPPKVQGSGGRWFDPIIDSDCPTAVKVPSGKWFSVPRPDLGETFMSYCWRVFIQAHGSEQHLNASTSLIMAYPRYFEYCGGFKEDGSNWHIAADCYYNGFEYIMTPEQKAKIAQQEAESKEAWSKWEEEKRRQANERKQEPEKKQDEYEDIPISGN